MASRRSRKQNLSKADMANQRIEDDLDVVPSTDALRRAVRFSELPERMMEDMGSRKDDPALMDWDEEIPGWTRDHGGLDRPVLILMGAQAWSYPKSLTCPLCGGEGTRLDCGPKGRTYCGYCDRYGQDTIKLRHQIEQTTKQLIISRRKRRR